MGHPRGMSWKVNFFNLPLIIATTLTYDHVLWVGTNEMEKQMTRLGDWAQKWGASRGSLKYSCCPHIKRSGEVVQASDYNDSWGQGTLEGDLIWLRNTLGSPRRMWKSLPGSRLLLLFIICLGCTVHRTEHTHTEHYLGDSFLCKINGK